MKSNPEELVIVVDENDKVLDFIPRSDAHKKKLLHRTISISVFNEEGKVMLHQRSMNKDTNPGMISNSCGGHVSKGQDYLEAAEREIKEELDLKSKLVLIKKMIINDPTHRTMTSIYTTVANGPFNFDKEEMNNTKFYSKDEIEKVSNKLSESARIILKEQGLI